MKKNNFNIFKSQQRPFPIALLASIAVHILLAVFIVAVSHDKPLPKKDVPQVMDVVLLDEQKKPSKKVNKDARTISNKNAIGSSRNAKDHTTRKAKAPMRTQQQPVKPTVRLKTPPKTPLKAPPRMTKPQPELTPAKPKKPQPTLVTKRKPNVIQKQVVKPVKIIKPVKNIKPARTVKPPRVVKKRIERPRKQVPLANLMPSAMALSQLSQDFERERRMKQQLSREADIPINTKQAKYAPYAQALVRALEEQWRPGHAQYEEYSERARRSLIKMTIERDGSLGGIEILRPSPIPEINKSAIKAIQDAAPFKILPSSWGLDRVSFYLTFEVVENGFVFRSM